MSSAQKLSQLLIAAKDEYVNQIADIMAPFVINVVNTMYTTAKKNASFGKFTRDFQRKLKEIPLWNQSLIDAQTVAISNKYKYFPELVAAVFVSYVKILSSVKIHSHKPHIQLKLPADDVFVHHVYINVAKNFYMDPTLVKAPRDVRLALVRNAVETTVRELLPIEQILRAYLGTSVDNEGVRTEEIDEEEIDLSPSPEDVVEAPDSPDSQALSVSSSPVQALGDPEIAPSPVPSVQSQVPTDANAQAIEQLKDILRQTAPVPISQPQQVVQSVQSPSPSPLQPPIYVPKTNPNPGAFVSPVQPRGLGFDTTGDQFFS
ncbi:hypothetical protein PBCVNY2B_666R [Paramecium bursaria Chlorella virus NY2B]|uniref:Uncharacterized protein n=1 Tax=Paramecium bursaria Chlorella virus NYs1 TaxID=83442 RepID=M1HHQ0_9PHYC|nr:hypothetical protein AR158_C590R [Paramecium bursaria Chlorella virus AR158]YP_009665483.1 hypothetical protein FK949_gp287 [Paramecium bursaria Chlorella virus NYs1]AGE54337.1 hypothetical protein PBCVIL52s1_683R [Paramecium bursaria Chlorella virus IL-5-2s1]AGE55023.1 hypothetical protein PBCVMA1D_670R [Paramecium bursaria Chlorella virus MA1D]AGE58455.1 hypothetical protein PBCVNY2B_666R [Paramecium bursaria Chlorella virus NY2B]ABU44135.1 hypothetical protein AR158_C590R [Paramecium bur